MLSVHHSEDTGYSRGNVVAFTYVIKGATESVLRLAKLEKRRAGSVGPVQLTPQQHRRAHRRQLENLSVQHTNYR